MVVKGVVTTLVVKAVGTVDVDVVNDESAEIKMAVEAINITGMDPMIIPISQLVPLLAMKWERWKDFREPEGKLVRNRTERG